MGLVHADRVKETTTTTGMGTLSLAGAATGFRTFVAGIGSGNFCCYAIENGTDWEVGIGRVTSGSPDTLSRLLILSSSNSGSAVNWGAGTKNVFVSLPASHARTVMPGTVKGVLTASPASTGTSLSISNVPGLIKEGNLLVAVIGIDASWSALSDPSGFAAIAGAADANEGVIRAKVATAADEIAASFDWSWTTTQERAGAIYVISGKHAPVEGWLNIADEATGTSAAPQAPSVATSGDDRCLVLRAFVCDDDDTPYLQNDGSLSIVERFNLAVATNGPGVYGGEHKQTGAGATGTFTFSMNATEEWAAWTVAINQPEFNPRDEIGLLGGYHTINLPAVSFRPRATSGCGQSTYDSGASDVTIPTLDFDTTTQEYAHSLPIRMPKGWDGGPVLFFVDWTNTGGSSTQGVAFSLAGRAFGNDDAINGAFGTAVVVTDTWLAQNDWHETPVSLPVTIGNSPQEGDTVIFELSRVVSNGADNMAGDALVGNVTLLIKLKAVNDL